MPSSISGVPGIISSRDFYVEVLRGLVPGFSVGSMVGRNPDVDLVPEDVWAFGGNYPFLSSAVPLEVVSSSVLDTALGTGAQTVLVTGLDENFSVKTEIVSLNGTTPVLLSGTWFRINDFIVVTAGSGFQNAGNISVQTVGGGTIQAYILIGAGRAQQAVFTVPSGHTAFVLFSSVGMYGGGLVEFDFRVRAVAVNGGWITRNTLPASVTGQVWTEVETRSPLPIFEKTDMIYRVVNSTANNQAVTAQAQFLLVSNTTT